MSARSTLRAILGFLTVFLLFWRGKIVLLYKKVNEEEFKSDFKEQVKEQVPKIVANCFLILNFGAFALYRIWGGILPDYLLYIFLTLIISTYIFYKRKNDIRMILSILLFLSIAFFATYSYEVEVVHPNYISSNLYIQKAENLSFYYLDSRLIFANDATYFQEEVFFSSQSDTMSALTYNAPYINASYTLAFEGNFSLSNGTIEHIIKNFNRDNGSSIEDVIPLNASGLYKITIFSRFEPLQPNSVVDVILQGWYGRVSTYMGVSIDFPALNYECLNPCARINSANVSLNPSGKELIKFNYPKIEAPYQYIRAEGRTTDSLNLITRVIPTWPSILRTLLLSVIAGMVLALFTTIIKIRDKEKSK